jgi:KDO2-lipid IV(A) lauroyltransferase
MAKRRSRAADYAVYLAVRTGAWIVQTISWDSALSLARALARLAYHVDHRHRQVAAENLRHAFPNLDGAAVERIVRAAYLHFVRVAIEMIRMPRAINRSNAARIMPYANPADYNRILEMTQSGRPLMTLTGHFGNWEVLNYVFGFLGFRAGVIARRLDNPYLDRLLHQLRQKTGQVILDKSADYDKIMGTLRRGGNLGILGDQDAGARGQFVDFFGRPASTFKSIALLSLEYSAPILVFGGARVGDPMQYRLYIEDVILPEEYSDAPDATRLITQRYTAALERLVRRHPEQYFWLHRRWKHKPPVRKAKRAA